MEPFEYYSKDEVREEIASFLKDRWAAVEGYYSGERRFARYLEGRPLRIRTKADVLYVLKKYPWARSFYGTIATYDDNLEKVRGITLFWDVDCDYDLEPCRRAAKQIGEFLRSKGVEPWIKFSGRGFHVHVNERCYNWDEVEDPFEVARRIVRYVASKALKESEAKVEILVDRARVTTSPLSLHRELDLVAVAMTLDELDEFEISWADPKGFRHNREVWRSCKGSLENLVRLALSWRPILKVEQMREPGRFPVMALLQAARYYLMTGDLEKAKSFGLNRAIFYAWLKYYYNPGKIRRPRGFSEEELKRIEKLKPLGVLKDKAPVSPRGWFMMGGVEQRPEDFDRQVARRFEEAGIPFQVAWEKALAYVSKFPEHVLKDPNLFFRYVYEPVRDNFLRVLKGEAKASLPAYYKFKSLEDFFKKKR